MISGKNCHWNHIPTNISWLCHYAQLSSPCSSYPLAFSRK